MHFIDLLEFLYVLNCDWDFMLFNEVFEFSVRCHEYILPVEFSNVHEIYDESILLFVGNFYNGIALPD